jgi:CRISPR-associated protein Csd1
MGLLQKACETYDTHKDLVGVPQAERQTLVPISHIITSADIEITVNQDGKFVSARALDKSEPKIIIPATEDSGGRTSAPCAHPLCDQLGYIAPYDEKKHPLYVAQLTAWAESEYSHPMLSPILTYVKNETILVDLTQADLVQFNAKGVPEKEKAMICWRVVGTLEMQEACWLNQDLFRAFSAWYAAQRQERACALCMISGDVTAPAAQHPKGIVSINGNAKLISANDNSGFTFRGRFTNEEQAATISYLASQKAHNALRWLIANQGVPIGGRTFLCWNPQGKPMPQVTSPLRRRNAPQPVVVTPSEYRKELALALASYQYELPENKDGVVIAAFDAATTGRLSLTYYNELRGSDFLQRLHDWDSSCCWWNGPLGIQSPSLKQIILCAFGTQREEKLAIDDRVLKQQMQRLVACRMEQAKFPSDIEQAVVHKASNLQIYDTNTRALLLFVACAVIKKYRYDTFKEEWEMSLETNKQDRSYQFGRLLAVLEKAERDTYQSDENREPNAVRRQSIFVQRPFAIGCAVWGDLRKAYLPRLKPGHRATYEKLFGEIMEQLSQFPEHELNLPLQDTYMLGYYLQRNELYKSKKEKEAEEE